MKPRGVAVHPSQTRNIAAGWRSPVAATLRIEGQVTRAHPECGNGVTWSLELRRGSTRQYLAQGEARNATPVTIGPFDRVRVQPGDLISILVGPREGNHSCDLDRRGSKAYDRREYTETWSLANDVAGDVLAGNPHADSAGHANIWHFYSGARGIRTEPTPLFPPDHCSRAGSSAESPAEKQKLAEQLEQLLTGPAPASDGIHLTLRCTVNSRRSPARCSQELPRARRSQRKTHGGWTRSSLASIRTEAPSTKRASV